MSVETSVQGQLMYVYGKVIAVEPPAFSGRFKDRAENQHRSISSELRPSGMFPQPYHNICSWAFSPKSMAIAQDSFKPPLFPPL